MPEIKLINDSYTEDGLRLLVVPLKVRKSKAIIKNKIKK